MKLIMLINVKMPRIVDILTFTSMINTASERFKAKTSSYNKDKYNIWEPSSKQKS